MADNILFPKDEQVETLARRWYHTFDQKPRDEQDRLLRVARQWLINDNARKLLETRYDTRSVRTVLLALIDSNIRELEKQM